MGIIFKVFLGLSALASMFLGSLGFQSNNIFVGGICVIIGIICLIYLLKFLWELIGCITTLALIVGLVVVVLYATGAFNSGSSLVPNSLSSLLGKKEPQSNQTLYGNAVAVSGDMMQMGELFYIYGISAPKLDQTCVNNIGRQYNCGQLSKNYLQEKIQGQQPVCTILSSAQPKGVILPVICNVGEYDLGALMVAGGWAIPDINSGSVYVKYEAEAKKRKNGLWQGTFNSPWEWERMKIEQIERLKTIKVDKPKKEQSLLMKNFWN